jgi:hypothetical protein
MPMRKRLSWEWRRAFSCLNSSIVSCPGDPGIMRTLSSISAVNAQSMSLAKLDQRIPVMKVTLVHLRGLNRTFENAAGAPLQSCFLKPE